MSRAWYRRGLARWWGNERGSVIVEFSFVATLLVTLVIGVIELGGMWGSHQLVTHASRSGARVGAQLGVAGATDSEILLNIQAALGDKADQVTRVVVYEADVNGDMPAPCVTATPGYSGGSNCNVYGTAHLAQLGNPGWWGSGTSCGSADANWCSATARNTDLYLATHLGVRVEVRHDYVTNFFGGDWRTMSDTTVMRLEPVE